MENVTSLYGKAISKHEEKIVQDATDLIDSIVSERIILMRKMRVDNNVNFYNLLSREIMDLFDEALHRYFKLEPQEVSL
jgi:hypothetical protein